jgi:hypothetical protein
MKRVQTEVHQRLDVLGVKVSQFLEDFGMSSAGFYRALMYRKGEHKPTKTVLADHNTIEFLMDNCDTRRAYDNYVKEHGVKEKAAVAQSIDEVYPYETGPSTEKGITEEAFKMQQVVWSKNQLELKEKIAILEKENAALKTLLKIYMV